MIHKISDLCKKIDGLKTISDRLYNTKYNQPKTPERDAEVNNMIEDTLKKLGVNENNNINFN